MFKRLLMVCLFVGSSNAFAVETIVPPGGGLQAAIAAAADGDVIILQSGVYSNADTHIEIGVSLTIRAESAAAAPIIEDSLNVPNTISIAKLVIQGVQVDAVNVTAGGTLDELELLEVTLTGGSGITAVPSSANMKKFTMIGSSNTCVNDVYISIYAGDIVFAGNSICKVANLVYLNATEQGGKSITVVGNTFNSLVANSGMLSISYGGEVLVAANRFVQRWAKSAQTYSGNATFEYYFIHQTGNERFTARNNIFSVKTDRVTAGAVVDRIRPVDNVNNFIFENNIVDAGNMGIWAPGLGEVEQEAMIENGADVPASLRGNIFINYQDNVLPLAVVDKDLGAKNNLCFNNSENCGTIDGNLDVDPQFIDTIDYKLTAGTSPAIDTGITDVLLSDLDGTRNDMGAYGGSWSIDQYDVQRDPAAVGPYIYPVIDAARGVASGNVRVRFVSYGRQL